MSVIKTFDDRFHVKGGGPSAGEEKEEEERACGTALKCTAPH